MQTRLWLALVLVATAALCSMAVAPPVAAATDRLPDLKMAPIYDVYLQRHNGKVRLRFGSNVWNIGQGPLEARGTHRVKRRMTEIRQVIYATDGSTHSVTPPDVIGFFAGDGHGHWHLSDFVLATLYPITPEPVPPALTDVRRLRKIGFCLVDSTRMPVDVRPPNSATHRAYHVSGCGTRDSQRFKMGISVGWADVYPASIAYQWIDVTGVAAGDYRLCATPNPAGAWREVSLTNNSAWIDLHLDLATNQLTILGQGEAECQPDPTVVLDTAVSSEPGVEGG
jgi:hypothetical protein